MKRIIPLILASLLLAACGAETLPAVTGAETPQPTALPEPAPEAEPVGLPQYFTQPRPVPEALDFPDCGFAVEECYLAEPFGLSGRALLLRGTDEGGGERFACRYISYAPEGGDYVLLGGSVEGGAEELGVREQGGALTVSVPRLAEGVPSPEVFYPVGRETALRAYRDMPYLDEIELPLDRDMSEARLAGTPGVVRTGGHEYEYEGVTISCREFWTRKAGYIYSFYSATPGAPISVRGLKIGESTLEDALARFPYLLEEYTLMGGPLYGGPGGLWGEPGMSDQGNPDLSFWYEDSFLRLSFGEDGILHSVFWSTSEYDDVTYKEDGA
ncbi:MAG TPA: hypothetical protein IAC18_02615 [Candidatus Scatomorpha merdipullorum]|uniref:Uncharacterized protein n=1 Tax=Candidatus Scatomorpha merdipullorum TaxID=2840927 RepID=A0A9D1FDQ9_9FIRM|nr:hypothetical protein [Candidatus Scatomorpha merdipullorum]